MADPAYNAPPPAHAAPPPPGAGASAGPTPAGPAHNKPALPIPPYQPKGAVRDGQWTTGLFDCFEDLPSCAITYFLPCVGHGLTEGRIERTPVGIPTALFCLTAGCCLHLCLWGPQRREKLRKKYGLPEEPASDLILGCCCGGCIICQEWRELDARGVPMHTEIM